MLQILPNAEEKDIEQNRKKILSNVEPISALIDKGLCPEEIAEELFGEFNIEILEKKELQFKCNCNREKNRKSFIKSRA